MMQAFYAAVAAFAFSLIFNIDRKSALFASVAGGLSWAIYLAVFARTASEPAAYLLAALFTGLASELLAVALKKPATLFVVSSMIPLVPGANLYRTMVEAVAGRHEAALSEGIRALVIAGAIATGLALAASLARIYSRVRRAV